MGKIVNSGNDEDYKETIKLKMDNGDMELLEHCTKIFDDTPIYFKSRKIPLLLEEEVNQME